mmetsp:Transcript_15036/g.19625  ORF Transcript_15036/g.19625 Transcript_15036/m.19625 type:complete len:163 (-) Transcript_15036:84-572(-)|eukprot:CAMPEP_0116069220 /NCGR_PEP_ID=MMETSP0322-20121206/12153_1 /TAXON_ID=163516 /ORGANISM="Leptocylindrus danicus var. apora, Strain B651" /LENGTH=162 /DNA_ID=CAMNT_0003556533 /DNA_START=102 /DNA_END=590 /DNA_ORIENTATION=-
MNYYEERKSELASMEEMKEKLEAFLNEKLLPRLNAVVATRDELENEISEYKEVAEKIDLLIKRRKLEGNRIQQPLHGKVNLGHKLAFARAVVDDPETIFLDVGYGFHVEFGLQEAADFIVKRINFVRTMKLSKVVKESNEIAQHYKETLLLLENIREETEKM